LTFAEARAAYPVLERVAYLNAGTFGPLARATADAMHEDERLALQRGRAGKEFFERMLALRASVRAKLAAAVGAPPEHVALATSTTDACNTVVNGLRLGRHDEVVTTDVEHFGLVGALAASEARVRVARIHELPAAAAYDAIRAQVTSRTRLLALSHVSWLTGHVLPARELRELTGLPVLVDGAQAAGAIPVDATAFDFYTVSAQKWLCGPDATGALVVADPDSLAVTAPSYFSQSAYDLAEATFEPQPGAARFDTGWIATASLAGLDAALDVHPDWRFDHAAEQAARCRELLAERYEVVTEPGHATLVSIRWPDEDPAQAATRAFKQGVLVRDLPGTDLLRVSCGYWTSDEDLERLVAALA
jgi:L-cysteine/cystine lyase